MITDHEALYSTSEALERANALFLEAGKRYGLTFSPTGRSTGFSARIGQLLKDAGFCNIRCQALAQDGSFGQPDRDHWFETVFLMGYTFRRFVVTSGVATDEEIQSLLDQQMIDVQDPRFGAMVFYLMAWAEKSSTESDH
jgi:hypothetical protein